MIYLDTSVLVSYYCPEPVSSAVEKIILKTKQPAISHLTEVELVSAISKKIREKNLSRFDGEKILEKFQSHITQQLFQWIPVNSEHFRMAKAWIVRFKSPLRTLDALHLAIVSSNRLTLVTSDIQLAKSAGFFRIKKRLIDYE